LLPNSPPIEPVGSNSVDFPETNPANDQNPPPASSEGSGIDEPPESPGLQESSGIDLMSALPTISDIPDALVLDWRESRSLDVVVEFFSDPFQATQNLTAWGLKGNAACSFQLADGQDDQHGALNGVYVSIYEFDSPESTRDALDFMLLEKQLGEPLDEIAIEQFGEYSRGLLGLLDYGYEATIFIQTSNVLIRVSAAEKGDDPSEKAKDIASAILTKLGTPPPSNEMTNPDTGNPSIIDPSSNTSSEPVVDSNITTGSENATLLMTFRACPEGFDPDAGNFYAECTIPLDAPDASVISWGGGSTSIMWLERRDYDGAYIYDGSSGTMNVQLSGLAPVVRNSYLVFGDDFEDGSTFTVDLADGETRELYIFYYY
jgi:hypothetical protein